MENEENVHRRKGKKIMIMKERTEMNFDSRTRAPEDMTRWKGVVVKPTILQGYGLD